MTKLLSNYHTHTYRCRHASGTDEEYVQAALDKGLEILGFSDHEEITEDNFYPGNNGEETLKNYVSSINNLKEKYKNKITIEIGLEALYLPKKEEHYNYLLNNGIDYLILGQHDVLLEDGRRDYILHEKATKDRIRQYTNLAIRGMKTGLFKYMAHPDLYYCAIDKITPFIKWQSKRLCKAAKKYDLPLEINIGGFIRNSKYHYPNETFFKIAKKCGCKFIIGVDAHNPSNFEDRPYDKCEDFINKLNLEVLEKL